MITMMILFLQQAIKCSENHRMDPSDQNLFQ